MRYFNGVINFEKVTSSRLKPKNCVCRNTNDMLSNHEIWYIYVILCLHFIRKLLT